MSEIRKELDEVSCKSRILEMLVVFDQFCEKYDLTYFLSWGTLIGAMRHKGFIPWDDDIDISMPRKDYNRLIELSKTWDLPYDLLCWEKDPDYPKCYGKLSDRETILENFYMKNIPGLGLFIDIFPVDDVTIDEKDRALIQKRIVVIEKMLTLASMKKFWPSQSVLKTSAKYVMYLIAKFKGTIYWRNKRVEIIKQIMSIDGSASEYCACDDVIVPSEWFAETEKTEFEGYFVSIPKEADRFLRYYFGDYMMLPPVDKRVSNHDYKVYRRSDS